MTNHEGVTASKGDRKADILSLLHATHKAWRTLSVPGITFAEDRALPVDDFTRKYARAWKNALHLFWKEFAPFEADEFVFNFYCDSKIWYFLTSQRLIVWDTSKSSHWSLAVRDCVELTPAGQRRFIARMNDGGSIEIVSSSVFFSLASRLPLINAVLAWKHNPVEARATSVAGTAGDPAFPENVRYVACESTVPLRSFYAKRGALWATSIPVIVWLTLLVNSGLSGTGLIVLPGILGIALLGLLGYLFGYALGSWKDRKLRIRRDNTSNRLNG